MRILPSGILVALGICMTALPVRAMGLKSLADDTAAICAGLNAVGPSLDLTAYPELQSAMTICKKFSPFAKSNSEKRAASAASLYSDDPDDSDDNMNDQSMPVDTPTTADPEEDASATSETESQVFGDV